MKERPGPNVFREAVAVPDSAWLQLDFQIPPAVGYLGMDSSQGVAEFAVGRFGPDRIVARSEGGSCITRTPSVVGLKMFLRVVPKESGPNDYSLFCTKCKKRVSKSGQPDDGKCQHEVEKRPHLRIEVAYPVTVRVWGRLLLQLEDWEPVPAFTEEGDER